MRLAIKIGIVLTSSTFALIASYAVYETKRSEQELLQDAKASNKALLAQTVPSMVKSFWSFDKVVLDAAMSSFFDFGDVRKVLLFNEKGVLFFGFEREGVGAELKTLDEGAAQYQDVMGTALETPGFEESKQVKDIIEEIVLEKKGDQNRLVAPLWVKPEGEDPKFLGKVVLDYSTGYITQRVDDLRRRVWGLAILLSGAISLVAILYLRRAAVQPISQLAGAAADMAKHVFTKVPEKKTRDEIGLLTHRFNNMVDEIQTHMSHQRKLADAVRICSQSLNFDDLKHSISQAFSLMAEQDIAVEFHLLAEQGFDPNSNSDSPLRTLGIQSSSTGEVVAFVRYLPLSDKTRDSMCLPLFEALCITIANTIRNIEFAMEQKEHGRIEAEIEATKTIQEALIPKVSSYPNLEMAYHYKSADTTGGDWYGHHFHEETGTVYLFVGDVTGHGVPSALITGVVCGAVMSGERRADSKGSDYTPDKRLKETLQILNNVVLETGSRSGKLMTMFIVALDINTGHIWTINAGHNPPIVVRKASGQSKTLVNMGSRLGFTKDGNFQVKEYDLEAGDVLFLYTDGLVENTGPNEEVINMKALIRILQSESTHSDSIVDIVKKVVDEGEAVWKGHPPGDDVTILAVKWLGTGGKMTKAEIAS